ncbi:helicase C-terminal domain-containing protein [Treponema sp. HNW]|uniref:ATP-dependent DNA helicase n=1 Tax=Treponema sp. HNW TaxID=3116654 RepID=UPI003D134D68
MAEGCSETKVRTTLFLYTAMEVETENIIPLDPLEVSAWLSEGGPARRIFPGFEEREGQLDLLRHVCTAFNEDKIGVFEAGTGVGKSFAYLIPAVLWAEKNKERAVISTGTINLQQQLFEKDIPALRRLLGIDFKAAIMKGRQNYLCLRRLRDSLDEADLFDEEKEVLLEIAEWAKISDTGSISDLSFMPSSSLWQRVNSESDACLANRCPFYESCFVMKMRKKAAEASILIVNHHLLFADIAMRSSGAGFSDTAVLPPYKRLVLDEAHGIEAAATSFFSSSVNRFTFIKQLNKLYRLRKSAAGLLCNLQGLSAAEDSFQEAVAAIQLIRARLGDMEDAALTFFDGAFSCRLCEATAARASDFIGKARLLAKDVDGLCASVRNLIDGINDEEQSQQCVWETKLILHRLENAAAVCTNFAQWQEKPASVFWAEKHSLEKGGFYPVLYETPLDTSSRIYENLFEPIHTVVCTSATLTLSNAKTGDGFSYWLRRTGARFSDKERLLCAVFESPFNYKQDVLLSVVSDMPLPNQEGFQQMLEQVLVRLIRSSAGRALVLFTSYESLQSACAHARLILAQEGIRVLKQGDDDRFRLLETFKKDTESVLFATDSFWEGVDVPGESLSQVIIVKLPFRVPSDPVFQARCEDMDARGLSSFFDLSLPEAIIRFRQGFGRLIRHSCDRGAVSVLDKRLISMPYGTLFLNSVPESRRCFAAAEDVCSEVRRFTET